MRIVLDSNILVRAAWKAEGLASRLLRSVIEGPHRLIVSPFILGEVARVLAYPRIQSRWGLTEERIQGHVASIPEKLSYQSYELGRCERLQNCWIFNCCS